MNIGKMKAAETAAAIFLSMLASGAAVYAEDRDSLKLSLQDVFSRIESENSTMTMLRSAKEAAEEGIRDAKNARYPDIEASVNVSYIGDAYLTDRNLGNWTKAPSPHFGNGFTIDASQVIYAGGALNSAVKMAGLASEAASVQIDKSREGLRLMAAGQYLDLYKLANNIRVYRENIALTEKLIEEIQAKREAGVALANDVTRYELRLELLKLDLTRLQNTSEILNYRICNMLNLPETSVIVPDLAEETGSVPVSAWEWHSSSLQSSPELRMSGINAEMAEVRHALAKSAILPKIAVVAHEGFDGPITFEIPPIDKNLNIWYVGIGLKYDFGALYKAGRKIKQAAVQSRQAAQAETVAEENLRNEVQQAYLDWRQAYVELETRRKSLQLAEENYERVYDRYVEQLALTTDMLDAFNMKLDSELGVQDAEAEIEYRLAKLKYAAGIL